MFFEKLFWAKWNLKHICNCTIFLTVELGLGIIIYHTETYFNIFLILIFLGSATPIFFILSPGVNPLKDVETLGKQLGYTSADKNFHIVSLGQGQEVVAESAMNRGAKEG